MATDYQQEAIDFIRSFDSFSKDDYDALVEVLRRRFQIQLDEARIRLLLPSQFNTEPFHGR